MYDILHKENKAYKIKPPDIFLFFLFFAIILNAYSNCSIQYMFFVVVINVV